MQLPVTAPSNPGEHVIHLSRLIHSSQLLAHYCCSDMETKHKSKSPINFLFCLDMFNLFAKGFQETTFQRQNTEAIK